MTTSLDLESCIKTISQRELLSASTLIQACDKLKELLSSEPNIRYIQPPVSVVGDIRGQFYDLIELFRVGGPVPDTNYLFLGDYADNEFSVETITLLFCLKLRFTDRITLLRGKHETRLMSKTFGLYNDVIRKYGDRSIFDSINEVFDFFPLAGVIGDRIFCVHSGISPEALKLDQMRILNRFQEVKDGGIVKDLLFSVPDETLSPGDKSKTYNKELIEQFLSTNGLNKIIRSGQLCMDGYQEIYDNKLTTIWSAPNYYNRCGNVGCIVEISETLDIVYNTFTEAPEFARIEAPRDFRKEFLDYYK